MEHTGPVLGNNTFVVAAHFNKQVQPLGLQSVEVAHGRATAVHMASGTEARITVEGVVGAQASVALTAFNDLHGNTGVCGQQVHRVWSMNALQQPTRPHATES